MSVQIIIHKSFEELEPYIDLARGGADSERDALGFLPLNAYKQAAVQGKLFVATNELGEFLGHLMFGGVFPQVKVIQVYCKLEFRRQGVAEALIDELVRYAEERSYLTLTAKVASDLTNANAFYEQMGFQIVDTVRGGKSRNRIISILARDLNTPSLFGLMSPGEKDLLPSLNISQFYNTRSPIYAIDLNVLFDVSKQRIRRKNAGLVFNAGFRNDIRLVIAQEFVEELRRTSQNLQNDPHLQLALQLNSLPAPKPAELKAIEKRLASKIFPDRANKSTLSVQDESDLRHLATAIHHSVAGFITSEKAILRAHEFLRTEYGLDILAVSDFADSLLSDEMKFDVGQITRTSEIEIRTRVCTQLLIPLKV